MSTQEYARRGMSGLLQFLIGLIVLIALGIAGFVGWQRYGAALIGQAQYRTNAIPTPGPREPGRTNSGSFTFPTPATIPTAAQPAAPAVEAAPPTAAPEFQPAAPAGINPATGGVMKVAPPQDAPAVNPATQGPYKVGANVVVTGAPHTGESGRISFIDRNTGYITVTFPDGSIAGYAESELEVQ